MKLPWVIAAVILFTIGVIRSRVTPNNFFPEASPNVLSENTSESPSPTPLAATSSPTEKPATPSPTTKQTNNEWKYPGSTEQSSGVYISTDDPMVITNWYKDKIKSSGMNVKNFVQTKTNGKVKNILSGAGEAEVKIEITKDPHESSVKIQVFFES